MSIHNQYADISLTVAEIQSLAEQFDTIRAITDTLPEIDPLIMRHVPKMGKKTQTFSRDTFTLAAKRQHLLPRGLDLDAIEELFRKRDALQVCLVQAKHLAKHLELLLRLVGSDLFSAALAAYKAMKTNDRNAASDPILQELSRTFSRTKKREKKEDAGEENANSEKKVTGEAGGVATPAMVDSTAPKTSVVIDASPGAQMRGASEGAKGSEGESIKEDVRSENGTLAMNQLSTLDQNGGREIESVGLL